MRIKRQPRFDLCKKISTRKMVIHQTWIRKVLIIANHEENGESATSPLSRGQIKSKGGGKLSIHYCADGETIKTVFRTIISVNQLSIYGAVLDLCEEFKTCQARTGRRVLAGQCIPLSEPASLLVKRPTLSTDDPAQPENFTGRIIFMSMFNDFSWGSKDNEQECESSAKLVSTWCSA